ncbi:hypothetical protein FOA52_013185 [Chlamydomonas sp. UWO 241]|nr:hypothetical protein FOA52_013185 [Chlamydomonas sp. UWO 241]
MRAIVIVAVLALLALVDISIAAAQDTDIPILVSPNHGTSLSIDEDDRRCAFTDGTSCLKFRSQVPSKGEAPARGSKPCPKACSGVGTCNALTGACTCAAGWSGPDCAAPKKRPCRNMGADRRDKGWTANQEWSWSRCSGICDDDTAMCHCPPGSKYGRVPAPEGSAPGVRPAQAGRPLYNCNPNADKDGNPVEWGVVPYADLFGPDGWCESEQPKFTCPCRTDGVLGSTCNVTVEHSCLNQCSGRGECSLGFCTCHKGYYGFACDQKKDGVTHTRGLELEGSRPWLRDHVQKVPAAQEVRFQRRRPYVYVYDLPTEFNSLLLQYRIERSACAYRAFLYDNSTEWTRWTYSVEPVLHESMLLSPHRTLDPEEADFFYVPVYTACLFAVHAKNAYPRWPDAAEGASGPDVSRPNAAHNMLQAAQAWIAKEFGRYWERRGGRDHIWLMAHDEGACYAPSEIWPGIMLTHWGRTDLKHTSNSQYWQDDYSKELVKPWQPEGWLAGSSKAHACFDPQKDIVIPSFKNPQDLKYSPFFNAPPQERSIFMFFKGEVGEDRTRQGDATCKYSRCIRQRLAALVRDGGWGEKFKVVYGSRDDVPGNYGELLARSVFCLHLPGDGWSSRFEDAVLHGCIPVVVMDNVSVAFEGPLTVDEFSVRVRESQLDSIIALLRSVPPHELKAMQTALSMVWTRYRYNGPGYARAQAYELEATNFEQRAEGDKAWEEVPLLPGSRLLHSTDDAVLTIMQTLYSRMPANP